MASLKIRTDVSEVFLIGAFCDWDAGRALRAVRKPKARYIVIDDMPEGPYRIHCERTCSWPSCEIYPDDHTHVVNRRFAGDTQEVIRCFFQN